MKKILISFCLLALTLVHSQIVPLHKTIVNHIFQQNALYLIYVHGSQHNFEVEAIFNTYCFGEKLCAVLEPSVPEYHELIEYIGYLEQEYFLILDTLNKRKYALSINPQTFSSNDLLSFEYKYLKQQLQPFFASEPIPIQRNDKCSKLVGKNVGQFLRRNQKLKVILLYHLKDHCPTCQTVLKAFIAYAEDTAQQGKVTFSYFNTILNDHPIIHDQKTPSYLIFVDQQYQSPYQMQAKGSEMQGLTYFLNKMLNQQVKQVIQQFSESKNTDL